MKNLLDRFVMRIIDVMSSTLMYVSLRVYDRVATYRASHRFKIELSRHVSYPMVPRRRGRGVL